MYRKTGYRHKKAYQRDKKKSHVEWAEENVVFQDSSISPIPGRLRLKYSAHLRMPFNKLDIPKTKTVVGKFASQSGKSLLTTIAVGKRLDTDPAFVLLMLPTKDALPKIMKTKVNPNLKSIPKLWKKFEDYKTDESIRNKDTVKLIAGGGLVISGSTVGERKSLTVPMIVFDEAAEMETGTIQESSERTKSYSSFFPKIVSVSTIVSPEDEICTAHDACECKMEYHFVCPSCEESFNPASNTLNYISSKEYAKELGINETEINSQKLMRRGIETARIECPSCNYKIYQEERKAMIFDGKGMVWKVIEGDPETATSFGFAMNTLTSYFVSLGEFVEEFFRCGNDEIKLDKFYRGWFNEFYTGRNEEKIKPHDFYMLGNGIDEFSVPEGTVAMYLGVDTQKDHFWAEVKAYQWGFKPHTVWAGRVEDFNSIVNLFERKYYHANGTLYHAGVRRMGIDMQGYVEVNTFFDEETKSNKKEIVVNRPQEVKDFAYEMSEMWGRDGDFEKIYATRGYEFLPNDDAFSFGNTQVISDNYKDTRKLKYMKLGTVSLKLTLFQQIYRNLAKQSASETDEAYGYDVRLHYINQTLADKIFDRESPTGVAFEEQYTSEVYTYPKDRKGKAKDRKSFVQVKKDNHFIDTGAICTALALLDNIQYEKEPEEKSEDQFSIARSLV